MRYLAHITCLLVSLVSLAYAQKLDNPVTLPAAQMRVEIAEFESPVQSELGYIVARLVARDILKENPGFGGVHIAVPPTPDQRVSRNPEYLETLSMQNHASIVIWGEYYFEGDTVIIRPYLRLTPQAPMTEASYGLQLTTIEGPIIAAPPTMQINFTPILASKKALEEIEAAMRASRILREEPDAGARIMTPSPAIAVDTKPSMWMLESRGDWIKVRLHDNTTGWLEALNRPPQLQAGAVVTFTKATAMFVTGRYPAAEQTLATFVTQYASDEDEMNRAFVHTLIGTSRLRTMQNTIPLPDKETISREYLKAKDMIPDNPSPNDHLAVVRLLKHMPDSTGTYELPVDEFVDTEEDLIESVQKDKNGQSLENLRTFYRLAYRQKFLKHPEVDAESYDAGIQERIGIVAKVEEEERLLRQNVQIELVTSVVRERTNLMSFNGGVWLPKDAEKSFTFKNTTYDKVNATITQSRAYGGEIHYRNGMSFPLFFDFSLSGWYSTYELTRELSVTDQSDSVRSASSWVLIFPTHFGLSWTLFSGIPVEPYLNGGVGVAFGISGLNLKARASEINEDEKSAVSFSWYLGGGVDFFIGRNIALSISAKYQRLSFKEAMWTGQKDFTGLQLFAGLTYRL